MERASQSRRFTARLIDTFVVTAYYVIASIVDFLRRLEDWQIFYVDNDEYYSLGQLILREVPWLMPVVLYEVVMMAVCLGRTFGKMVTGIRVVNYDDGSRPLLGQVFVRWLVPTVAGSLGGILAMLMAEGRLVPNPPYQGMSAFVFGAVLSWLVVHVSYLWYSDRRGWPDKAAGTIVVRA